MTVRFAYEVRSLSVLAQAVHSRILRAMGHISNFFKHNRKLLWNLKVNEQELQKNNTFMERVICLHALHIYCLMILWIPMPLHTTSKLIHSQRLNPCRQAMSCQSSPCKHPRPSHPSVTDLSIHQSHKASFPVSSTHTPHPNSSPSSSSHAPYT